MLVPLRDRCILTAVGAARGTSSIAALRLAIGAFLAPHLYFIFFGTLDTSFAHLPVVLDLRFRKFAVFPEDDVEAESEYAQAYKNNCR